MEKSILTGMKDSINTEINASLRKLQIKTYFESTGIAYEEFSKSVFNCYNYIIWWIIIIFSYMSNN